jgi:hypothetical protein
MDSTSSPQSMLRTGHIMVGGIEHRKIFQDDKDREHFLYRLGAIAVESFTACYAWRLMPNHLLMRTGRSSIADVVQRLLTDTL